MYLILFCVEAGKEREEYIILINCWVMLALLEYFKLLHWQTRVGNVELWPECHEAIEACNFFFIHSCGGGISALHDWLMLRGILVVTGVVFGYVSLVFVLFLWLLTMCAAFIHILVILRPCWSSNIKWVLFFFFVNFFY